MRARARLRAFVAVIAVCVVVTMGGGVAGALLDAKRVPPKRWARRTCSALVTWRDALSGLEPPAPGATTTAVVSYLENTTDAATALVRGLRRAGKPKGAGGAAAARQLVGAADANRTLFADARDAARGLDPTDDAYEVASRTYTEDQALLAFDQAREVAVLGAAVDNERSCTVLLPSETPANVTVQVAQTALGSVLADADGHTLYLLEQDTADASACTGGCEGVWPPLTVPDMAVGGEGVDDSKLATTMRADGSTQVTYGGHRLYRYSGDSAPGETNGHGIAGVWFAVSPDGGKVAG